MTRRPALDPATRCDPACLGPLPESLREAVLPFLVARVVVLGALGLAHFIVDRTHPATSAWRPGCTPACSAGTPAGTRRSPASGYGPLGRQSLRFFPAVPAADARAGVAARPGRRSRAGAPGQRGGLRGDRHAVRAGAPRDGRPRRGPPRDLGPQPAAGRLRPRDGLRRVGAARVRARLLPRPAPTGREATPQPVRTSPSPACSPSAPR